MSSGTIVILLLISNSQRSLLLDLLKLMYEKLDFYKEFVIGF